MEYGQRIQGILDSLWGEMQAIAAGRKGRIVVGIPGERGSLWLPLLIPAFRTEHPDIEVRIMEGHSQYLEEKMLSGEVDVSLYSLPVYNPEIDYEPLGDDPIVIAASRLDPLAHHVDDKRNSPLLPQLISPSLIQEKDFLTTIEGSGMRRAALQILGKHNVKVHFTMELSRHETALRLAAEGVGMIITPAKTPLRLGLADKMVFFTLDDPPASRMMIAAYKRGRPHTSEIRAFIDLTKRMLAANASLAVHIEQAEASPGKTLRL